MARSFHRKKPLAAMSELNVTALIDLGFALLIIFMISTPLIQQEGVIELPVSTDAATERQVDERYVSITVRPGGYEVDGATMNRTQLVALLRSHATSARPPVISIRARGDETYQQVIDLLDVLKQNNLTRISLDTAR
jgi:biopolymer transport protein ExbD